MIFGLFKKKDPICGMKEEKGKGLYHEGNWFCNQSCKEKFEKGKKEHEKQDKGGSCCH